jgi:hypothetical protein
MKDPEGMAWFAKEVIAHRHAYASPFFRWDGKLWQKLVRSYLLILATQRTVGEANFRRNASRH